MNKLLVELHGQLIFDSGYLHALSGDRKQDLETRRWALETSRRNIWLATALALELGFPTMKVGADLWPNSL